MDTPQYAEGGFIPGGATIAWLHPDECLVSAENVRAGRFVCSRHGHPTVTSDCTTRGR